MSHEIRSIIEEFVRQVEIAVQVDARDQLASSLGDVVTGRRRPGRPKAVRAYGTRPSKGRRLQGQYIGRLRKLKGAKRAQVRAMAKKKGVAAAIALADRLAK